MSSSFMPLRRTATPADRFAASAPAPRTMLPLPAALTMIGDQPAPALPDPATLSRPLTPLPLFRPPAQASARPLPQPAPPAAPSEAANAETPHPDSGAADAAPEPVRGLVQARVVKKEVGSGIAPSAPKGGGPPPVQRKKVTGLPAAHEAGRAALVGIALDDVRVRDKAAQEVVQRSGEGKGRPINDDGALERAADTKEGEASQVGDRTVVPEVKQAESMPGTPVIQRKNRILKHEYRMLENPAHTVVNHLAWITGRTTADVWKDLDCKPPTDVQLARPDRVIAFLDTYTGSKARPALVTEVGHLGRLEADLRDRSFKDYDGGHLLALELFKTWNLINDASNVAPQKRGDNQWGAWRAAERALNQGQPGVLYEASVSYPDRTYTATAQGMTRAMKDKSTTRSAVENLSLFWRLMPWTVHTWVPSQYSVSVTPVSLSNSPTDRPTNLSGYDPTNWIPLVHRAFSPIKGTLARLIPVWDIVEHHQGFGGYLGGVDVRTLQNHPVGDALNEFKQMAWDIAKLTALVKYGLPLVGLDATTILHFAMSLPGIGYLETLVPGLVSQAPLAAILIYATTHQLNLTRVIPESIPGAGYLKYILGFLGL